MLKNRYFISYISTTLLYVTIIGLFLYMQQQTQISTAKSQERVMQVMLSDFSPEVIPVEEKPVVEEVEEPEVKEEEPVEPEVIEDPVPQEKEKVLEEPMPEPIVKPLPVLPKPFIEKPKQKPEVKKIVKKKPKKTVKKNQPKQKASKASLKKMQANPNEINTFYKKIRVKINENKFYPKMAKRRRMQGSVQVKFTILRSGEVSNIVLQGPKVFHNSVRHAVQSAFPISVKNIPVSLPTTVNITLRYQIR